MYNTIVFKSGEVVQWRNRDGDCNRFKVCLSLWQERYLSQENATQITADDCNGNEFATICRIFGSLTQTAYLTLNPEPKKL